MGLKLEGPGEGVLQEQQRLPRCSVLAERVALSSPSRRPRVMNVPPDSLVTY